jgi:tetratricopeptide (TPR) repeat protein
MDANSAVCLSRAVRLFVSSTFSDMQPERRVLVERVFPRISEWCAERGVSFTEIDLRWGITEQQAGAGQVLPICLEEVDNCRPFFLGILGDKYGTSARNFSPQLLRQHPWLAGLEGRSYTELEFIRGLWTCNSSPTFAFVYERAGTRLSVAEQVDSSGSQQLGALKARVRASGLLRREQGYQSAEELGDLIMEDLISTLSDIFPGTDAPSAEQRERQAQIYVRRIRGRRFIGPSKLWDQLTRYVLSNGSAPLVVSGPRGCGKTALLSAWLGQLTQEFNPKLSLTAGLLDRLLHREAIDALARTNKAGAQLRGVVTCTIGVTPRTSSSAGVTRFLIEQCQTLLHSDVTRASRASDDGSTLAPLLVDAAMKKRLLLLIDGLDQLGEAESDSIVASLPRHPPQNLRIILSASEGALVQRLRSKGYSEVRIRPWNNRERAACIVALRQDYGKHLPPNIEQRLLRAPQNALPLFLHTSLEELRIATGRYDLERRSAQQLSARTVDDLFEQMLGRYEESFETERPRLVRDVLSLLSSSRKGLQESEIRELLGQANEQLPARVWCPFLSAVRPHLLFRDGLFAIDRQSMFGAVGRRYLATTADQMTASSILTDFFRTKFPAKRALEELPWHLLWSSRFDELSDLLSNKNFLIPAWLHDSEEILRLFGVLQKLGLHFADQLAQRFEAISNSDSDVVATLAELLFALGHRAARLYAQLALRDAQHQDNLELTQKFSTMLALLHHRHGDLADADAMLESLIRRARQQNSNGELAMHLGNRGEILRDLGRMDEAERCFQEEKRLCEELRDEPGLATAIGHLGQSAFDRDEFNVSLTLFEDQIERCRRISDLRQLQSALGNAAACRAALGQVEEALALHNEEEELCRLRGDQHALQVSLGNQVRLLQRLRATDYDRAMALLEEREKLATKLGDPAAEAATLLQFSQLYFALSRSQFRGAAISYANKAAAIAQKHELRPLAAQIERWRETLAGDRTRFQSGGGSRNP